MTGKKQVSGKALAQRSYCYVKGAQLQIRCWLETLNGSFRDPE